MASTGTLDLKSEILLDHENIRELYSRYMSTPESDHDLKMKIANTIIREVAIHGDAEELSFYNVMEKKGKKDLAVHSKEEHADIKKMFYETDTSLKEGDLKDLDTLLTKAYKTFDEHAKEEEQGIIDSVTQLMTPEENAEEAKAFLKARTMVPPRPHPWAPQTGGIAQKAAGMQGTFHDKVINTIRGTDYVDLKYEHPSV